MKIHGGIKVGTMARIRNVPGTMAVAAPRVIIPARCHCRLKKPLECNQPHSSCHSLLASLEGALGERVPCLQGVLTRRNIAIPSPPPIQWMESASRYYTPSSRALMSRNNCTKISTPLSPLSNVTSKLWYV